VKLAWDDAAIEELEQAVDWYRQEAPHQIDRLLLEIDEAERLISQLPRAWNPLPSGYRSFRLNHFPYSLIYTDDDNLFVVAFIHQHRRPGYWRDRSS
jgi:toxin ParE2